MIKFENFLFWFLSGRAFARVVVTMACDLARKCFSEKSMMLGVKRKELSNGVVSGKI